MFQNYYKAGEIHEIQANYGNFGRIYICTFSQCQRQRKMLAAQKAKLQKAVQVHPDMSRHIGAHRGAGDHRSSLYGAGRNSRGNRRADNGGYSCADFGGYGRANAGDNSVGNSRGYAHRYDQAYPDGSANRNGKSG